MELQTLTYLVVGCTFAIYIGIAFWARADSTKDFYVAGGGMEGAIAALRAGAWTVTAIQDYFPHLARPKAARKAAGHGKIAGSIGPLVASYRPDVHPPHDEAVAKYAEVARKLAPHVDFLLCETVASVAHARSILEGAKTAGKPVWLSVTVDDEDGARLRSGEPVAEVVGIAKEGGADALLANCSAPEAMEAALDVIKTAGLPFGAYANGFTMITKDFLKESPTVDALSPRRDLGPETYANFVMGWVNQGATIVGGCCEVGPAHITEVARRLREAGHEIEA